MRLSSRLTACCSVMGISAAAMVGCASSGTTAGKPCEAQPGDSVYAAYMPAFRGCGVATHARLLNTDLHAEFTSPKAGCYSAEVEYVVLPNGTVPSRSVHLLKTNDAPYADAVITMVNQRRYEPATKDGTKVSEIIVDQVRATVTRVVVPAGTKPNPGRVVTTC